MVVQVPVRVVAVAAARVVVAAVVADSGITVTTGKLSHGRRNHCRCLRPFSDSSFSTWGEVRAKSESTLKSTASDKRVMQVRATKGFVAEISQEGA